MIQPAPDRGRRPDILRCSAPRPRAGAGSGIVKCRGKRAAWCRSITSGTRARTSPAPRRRWWWPRRWTTTCRWPGHLLRVRGGRARDAGGLSSHDHGAQRPPARDPRPL